MVPLYSNHERGRIWHHEFEMLHLNRCQPKAGPAVTTGACILVYIALTLKASSASQIQHAPLPRLSETNTFNILFHLETAEIEPQQPKLNSSKTSLLQPCLLQ